MNDETRELLEEIKNWMNDNDYECGEWGSDIYDKINELLERYNEK